MKREPLKSDIKLSGDIAWEEKIDCTCGADKRNKCTCPRTQEFKDRAEEIRENWYGEEWANPIKSELNTNTSNED